MLTWDNTTSSHEQACNRQPIGYIPRRVFCFNLVSINVATPFERLFCDTHRTGCFKTIGPAQRPLTTKTTNHTVTTLIMTPTKATASTTLTKKNHPGTTITKQYMATTSNTILSKPITTLTITLTLAQTLTLRQTLMLTNTSSKTNANLTLTQAFSIKLLLPLTLNPTLTPMLTLDA